MLLKNKLCILSNFNFCNYAKLPCYLKEGNLGWSQRGGSVPKFRQVEFIALPFLFSSKHKIWSFQMVVGQGQQSYLVVWKSMMPDRVAVLFIKPTAFFWHSFCHHCHSFLGSLLCLLGGKCFFISFMLLKPDEKILQHYKNGFNCSTPFHYAILLFPLPGLNYFSFFLFTLY